MLGRILGCVAHSIYVRYIQKVVSQKTFKKFDNNYYSFLKPIKLNELNSKIMHLLFFQLDCFYNMFQYEYVYSKF